MGSVFVVKPGLQTTVQDLGRWGHQASGVSVSGAMDRGAHRRANALVGNSRDTATLEVTLVGPELEFDDERRVAVCGAAFELRADGATAGVEAVVHVRPGSRLRFGACASGARACVAVSGGFDVPLVLGSRSTHLPSGIGGFEGRALRAGDRVPLGAPTGQVRGTGRGPGKRLGPRRSPALAGVLRVLAGPDCDGWSGAFEALLSHAYTIGSESNRMGYRLNGPPVLHYARADKLSEPTPAGTIQLLPTGLPVLFMADCPTTGGYAAIANVVAADLYAAAQLAPGDAVRFAACAPREALDAFRAREQELEALESLR